MAVAAIGLKTHIWNNNLKSIILLVLYPVILMGIVWACAAVVGAITGGPQRGFPAHFAGNVIYDFWPMIVTICLIWFMVAWFFHIAHPK